MSDSESDNEEFTIANDLVVTKYKMAGDIANRLVHKLRWILKEHIDTKNSWDSKLHFEPKCSIWIFSLRDKRAVFVKIRYKSIFCAL